jgi:acyl carrier protein
MQSRHKQPLDSALSIRPEEGVRAFARILSLCTAQVSVSAVDFTQTAQHNDPVVDKIRLSQSKKHEPLHSEPPSDEVSLQATSDDDVERRVAEIWQKLLGARKLSIYDNFFELGGDSLLGTQLLSLLRTVFQVQLPLQSLLEVPTVAGMAARIKALQ